MTEKLKIFPRDFPDNETDDVLHNLKLGLKYTKRNMEIEKELITLTVCRLRKQLYDYDPNYN